MMSTMEIKKCLVLHCLSNIFKLSNSNRVFMSLIERRFPMIADSDDFLDLDFISIRKMLSSKGLNVDSELQVFNAADSWLCHNITERSKNAKDLLSKVRLRLLTIPALKQVLNKVSSKYYECADTVEAILVNKQQLQPFSCNTTNRYCNQSNFNILVCGGRNCGSDNFLSEVKIFNANNFNEVNNFPHMKETRSLRDLAAVCIKGEVYVFGGNGGVKVEKYSPHTNTWKHVIDMVDTRRSFSACSFMDSVYIFGGRAKHITPRLEIATCFEFDTKSLDWKEISKMSNARSLLACSVFEGRIVVSGGNNNGILKTVEVYDNVGDTWENMPNMVKKRFCHKSVAVTKKLFIIGGLYTNNCEVFDSTTNKFTLLKKPTLTSRYNFKYAFGVIIIGSKFFVFEENTQVTTYDFENNEWSVKTCEATKDLKLFSVLKYL